MREFLEQFARSTDFMAHGYCLVWDPALLWLHAGSDIVTGLSYFIVAGALFYLVFKRRDLPFFWMFHLFGAFITACAITHFFAAWTIYVPSYWQEGIVKAGTAVISIATALFLVPFLPRMLTLPNLSRSLEENRRLNREMEEQIEILRKSEERFRSLIAGSHDGIVIANAGGEIILVNGGVEKIFGYGAQELVGKPVTILMPERYQERHLRGMQNFVSTGVSRYLGKILQFEGRRSDGSEFPLELNISSWVSSGGEINFGGVIRDVTERVRLEAETRTAHQRFKTLVDSLDTLVYVADFETHELLFVNKYGRDIWGDIAGQICWQTLQAGQTGPCSFCTNDRLRDAAGKPTGVQVWEFQNTANNEWYECRDQAIEWTDGRYVRMEIATNITARKRAEQEKADLERQIRTTQKMEAIGTLAGGIAHDFNNILVPIIAYTEMAMATEPQGGAKWQNLQEVYKAAGRAKELVKQILAFSREREHDFGPVQIVPVVKESLKLLKASLPSTIEVSQRIAAEGVTILGDPTQIHQVVMNLCTNAYHAMREKGGLLEVTLSELEIGPDDALDHRLPPGPYLVLTVSDTGPGMDQATMERIFDPYFTTKKHGEGTGLGLAIVLGIVKKCGGDIRVYSEPGQGASFQVYFPVLGKVEEGLAAILSASLATGDERILLVDDELSVVDSLQKMLEFHGYRITAKTSSVEALDAFHLAPGDFDLVITDQTMPYMTGDHLVLELRKIRPEIPIILCTGFSSMVDDVKARTLGIDAFLLKPILRKELLETIKSVLNKPRNQGMSS